LPSDTAPDQADGEADCQLGERPLEEQPHDLRRLCAERHPNADFLRALSYALRRRCEEAY
jgi:hypothetical protein